MNTQREDVVQTNYISLLF